jgi:ribosomal protein S7
MPYKDPEKGREAARKYYHQKKKPQDKERTILVNVRVPETILGRISQIASEGQLSGKYPWKSISQVTRAMIGFGLKAMSEQGDVDSAELMEIHEITKQFSTIAMNRRACQSMLENAKTEINALVTIGATTSALHVYDNVIEKIEDLTISEWTQWLSKELKALYPEFETKRVRDEVPGIALKTPTTRKRERDRANRGLRMLVQPHEVKKPKHT